MRNLLFFLVFGISISINAQTITPEVIATSGDYFSNSNLSIAWTIGEVVIETQNNANHSLTQGFHQPYYSLVSVVEANNPNLELTIFPNPVSDVLNIRNNTNQALKMRLIDCQGKTITERTFLQETYQYNLQGLDEGIYLLKIYIDNEIIETHKLIKISN